MGKIYDQVFVISQAVLATQNMLLLNLEINRYVFYFKFFVFCARIKL